MKRSSENVLWGCYPKAISNDLRPCPTSSAHPLIKSPDLHVNYYCYVELEDDISSRHETMTEIHTIFGKIVEIIRTTSPAETQIWKDFQQSYHQDMQVRWLHAILSIL